MVARYPAQVLLFPPHTTTASANAVLEVPPPIKDLCHSALLFRHHAIVAVSAEIIFPIPPPITEPLAAASV